MRDFFILWLERIINVIVILGGLGVLIGGLVTMFTVEGGLLAGLGIWFGGALYLMLMGGFIYLGLGIYGNTRRTADAVEKLASQS